MKAEEKRRAEKNFTTEDTENREERQEQTRHF